MEVTVVPRVLRPEPEVEAALPSGRAPTSRRLRWMVYVESSVPSVEAYEHMI